MLHQGFDWVRTVQRSLERLTGTWIGLGLAAIVLAAHPRAFGLALTVAALQFVIELCVVRNYALAVVFITPIALTVVSGGDIDRAELIRRVGGATQFSQAAVAERITELTAAGFLRADSDGRVQVTDEGQARWTQVRTAIGPITQRLWGDLPAEDLATAGRVLGIVLDRANALLVGP